MFLSIDAGNSNIVFGFFDLRIKKWRYEFRIETQKNLPLVLLESKIHLFLLENKIKVGEINGVGISSVVPEINDLLLQFCQQFFGQEGYLIQGKSYLKLLVSTKRPDEIGTDLMANMTAAYDLFKQTCIVVDFGTALTFSVVGENGEVLGVNIVPGLKTAIKALFMNTAKLPEVELVLPPYTLGQNTVQSIQAGILYGYTGLVKGMLTYIRKDLKSPYKVIATGGLSSILEHLHDEFDLVDRNLTLTGIKLIREANV
ncbi:type III pantothenate kinase [Pararhodonellum marinum]|uniref:type III pantothenate kinase n=1 Tax=Pararhodonellum marinum TaxID=2755358 RepID=UPI00188F3E77|nr:type III pantothenate kinase [Pararhodonellum marinum]